MELSPEERKKIYEEEKARIEAREQIEREKRRISNETSTGLQTNVASMLCYLGGWITGILFFILEQKNERVRFHAAQSILVFGSLTVIGFVLGLVPFTGPVFTTIVWIIGFILWVVLMVKAYNSEPYKLSWAGDVAEKMVSSSGVTYKPEETPSPPESPAPEPAVKEQPSSEPPAPETPPPRETAPAAEMNLDREIGRKVEEYFRRRRGVRITASAFAIAWSIALLIFFNYFYDYVAYYSSDKTGGIVTWTREPFFTSDINLWLPVLTTALIVSIIGHVFLIVFDRYILREVIHIVINAFALASVVTLVSVFPFDFYVIPNALIADGVVIGVTVVLICISVGIGIGILVRGIKLIANIVRGVLAA